MNLIFIVFLALKVAAGQGFFKCSPIDGSLDTYSFVHGSDSGVACVRGNGQNDLVFYIEKLTSSGVRKMAVGTAKYDSTNGYHKGHLFRLYPPGPKQVITLNSTPGYLQINFVGGPSMTLDLRPDGLIWNPIDIRLISGCALDTPQLLLNVQNPVTNTFVKSMLCAMNTHTGGSYGALYGFGLRQIPNGSWEPFFYLGQSLSPLMAAGSLNVVANVYDVCLKPDCTQCRTGLKSLTLTS